MTMKSGITKSKRQGLARVIKQMDSWIQHETNLSLWINTSLVHLVLFGRLVARQERLFLFDAHGEFCRVPLMPEHYACSLGSRKGLLSVSLKGDSAGDLELAEDLSEAEPRGEEEGPQNCQPGQESMPGVDDEEQR
jgi:hypothetical protein